MVRAVVLLVAGCVHAAVGDDVKAVPDQDLVVGVLAAGAGVDACIGQLQALNQQTPLHVEGAVVTVRELGGDRCTFNMSTHSSSCLSTDSRTAAHIQTCDSPLCRLHSGPEVAAGSPSAAPST